MVATTGNVYSVSGSGLTNIILNAGGGNVMASSANIKYIVAGDSLRRYDSASNSFTSLTALTTRSAWHMCSYNDRLVLAGSDPTATSSTFSVSQSILVYSVSATGALTTLLTDSIDAVKAIIALGALPFVFVVLVLVVCLIRALQAEGARRNG